MSVMDAMTVLKPAGNQPARGEALPKPSLIGLTREEMGAALQRSAASVNIRERLDYLGGSLTLDGYTAAAIDTGGRCLDQLSTAILKEDPKNRASAGVLSLQGWGVLKSRFAGWLKALKARGMDVVILCHAKEEKDGDNVYFQVLGTRGELVAGDPRLIEAGLHLRVERDPSQERHPHIERRRLAAALPEHVDLVVAVRRALSRCLAWPLWPAGRWSARRWSARRWAMP